MSDMWRAYRETDYQVQTPHGMISIHVDQKSATLDDLLREHAAGEWAFITAQNPYSEPTSPDRNEKLAAQLTSVVSGRGYRTFPGRGVGTDPAWIPEESLLIVGIRRADAIDLARQFQQNAIVYGQLGQPAELVDCRVE